MSTNSDCTIYEKAPGRWYYRIRGEDRGDGGPFGTYKAAMAAVERNHANPGNFSTDALPGCKHDLARRIPPEQTYNGEVDFECDRCGASGREVEAAWAAQQGATVKAQKMRREAIGQRARALDEPPPRAEPFGIITTNPRQHDRVEWARGEGGLIFITYSAAQAEKIARQLEAAHGVVADPRRAKVSPGQATFKYKAPLPTVPGTEPRPPRPTPEQRLAADRPLARARDGQLAPPAARREPWGIKELYVADSSAGAHNDWLRAGWRKGEVVIMTAAEARAYAAAHPPVETQHGQSSCHAERISVGAARVESPKQMGMAEAAPAPHLERAKPVRGDLVAWRCVDCGHEIAINPRPRACHKCGGTAWQPAGFTAGKSAWGTVGTASELTKRLIAENPGLDNQAVHRRVVDALGADRAGPLKNVAWYRNWLKRHAGGKRRRGGGGR